MVVFLGEAESEKSVRRNRRFWVLLRSKLGFRDIAHNKRQSTSTYMVIYIWTKHRRQPVATNSMPGNALKDIYKYKQYMQGLHVSSRKDHRPSYTPE